MSYDCSKILDYTHEVQRFCEAHKIQGCDNCPLMKDAGYCSASIFDITQKRINFVQKWSDEHLEKTRAEAFFEMFPKAHIGSSGAPAECFYGLIGNLNSCENIDCEDCWKEPYAGEFEAAREARRKEHD